MQKRFLRDYLIVALLVAVTALLAARSGDVTLLDDLDLRLELPARVGPYTAEEVRFCQSERCLHTCLADELTPEGRCPVCGGAVSDVSLAERRVLPADTGIYRRQYVNPRGEAIYVSIVVSGREQRSLHRPQQCLPAQGHVIESGATLDVALAGREPLAVMVLRLRHPTARGDAHFAYAYWFVGERRETPYHWQRLWWMSRDRLLRQQAHRWAYVAVSTTRDPASTRYAERLRTFIADLYPQLQPAPASAP